MCMFGLRYFRLRQKVKHLYKLLSCACGLCLFGVLISVIYKSSGVFPLSSPQFFCWAWGNFSPWTSIYLHISWLNTLSWPGHCDLLPSVSDYFAFNSPPSLSPDPHWLLQMSCWPLVQFSLPLFWAVLQIPIGSHQSSPLPPVHKPAWSWLHFPYWSPALPCSLLPT